MRSTIFLFFFLTSFSIFGQSKSLKIYSNFLLLGSERYSVVPAFEQKNNLFEFEQITIAFRKEKEKRYWEYEAGFLLFNNEADSLFQLKHIDGHIRVEKGYKFKESSNGKFKFYLSPALKGYYLKEENTPKTTTNFPITNWVGGINLALFVRGQYHFNDKWYLDVNTSLVGASFGINLQKIENPMLFDNQQAQGGFDFDVLSEQLLRIGLGYNF